MKVPRRLSFLVALGLSAAAFAQTAPAPAAQVTAQPQIHLRLIQLNRAAAETDAKLRARADRILERFKAGEKFADLAKELSDTARAKGGDWGWLKPGDLKKDFNGIAFALKAGEPSSPILLPEGAFILFVEARK